MKFKFMLALAVCGTAAYTLWAQEKSAAPAQKAKAAQEKKTVAGLKDLKQKSSYAIGLMVGKDYKRKSIDIDSEAFAKGLEDGLTAANPAMTEEDCQAAIQELQQDLVVRQAAAKRDAPARNKKEGEEFLAKNKDAEGVITTKSGLQYKILREGKGRKPSASDTVLVHYKGTLLDGTEFDSSYRRGEPAEFGVGQVIKGWTEALQLMPEGSKWQLFIPSNLAYGENPRPGGPIGPNATLLFDVELLEIK